MSLNCLSPPADYTPADAFDYVPWQNVYMGILRGLGKLTEHACRASSGHVGDYWGLLSLVGSFGQAHLEDWTEILTNPEHAEKGTWQSPEPCNHPEVDRIWNIEGIFYGSFKDHV